MRADRGSDVKAGRCGERRSTPSSPSMTASSGRATIGSYELVSQAWRSGDQQGAGGPSRLQASGSVWPQFGGREPGHGKRPDVRQATVVR